jgi:hypothetical protein
MKAVSMAFAVGSASLMPVPSMARNSMRDVS